jgi:hypothetical protein
MKKPFTAYYVLMLILISVSAGLKSQDAPGHFAVEKLQLCTDRTMYISGEKILFSAVIINENGTLDYNYSRILYCELITPDGNRITGGKYPVENSSAQGCLQIPAEAITGIYYLKSYTRFMRNGGPDGYHYIMLKIINPYKAEVITGHEVEDTSTAPGKELDEQHPGLPINISTDKKRYAPRENINLKIDGTIGTGLPMKLCLSVVPEMAHTGIALTGKMTVASSGNLQYFPETRGISLSGRLLENETGRPVPNALVNLSIIGDKDVMAIRTKSSGQFFFVLPGYTGYRDIFLCAEDISGKSLSVYIDNDFCPRPVNLPSPVFHLTGKEKETAYNLAVNQKITSVFLNDTTSGETNLPQNGKPFYGEPEEILDIETYIDLPTIEDYFSELLGAVNVRKSQGRKHFRFITTRPEMTIYDPLVLIDWVAVDDIDRILAMSPKEIDRIELVNSPYIKGNITYGGIISFVSKNNDFAGIDLPASGTFINYKFLEDCSGNIPGGPLPANLPDSRNTIYWDPDVQTDDKGSTDIFITAPDTPGKYVILIIGMGISGKELSLRQEIEVVGD